jgi:hypothetical protein
MPTTLKDALQTREVPFKESGGSLEDVVEKIFGRLLSAEEFYQLFPAPTPFVLELTEVMTMIEPSNSAVALRVRGDLLDSTNQQVAADFQRRFTHNAQGKLIAKHDTIRVADSYQKQQLGTQFIRLQLRAYRAIGVAEVQLVAADVGRYLWASRGWCWTNETAKQMEEQFIGWLARKMGCSPLQALGLLQDAYRVRGRYPWVIADFQVADRKLGKDFLLSPRPSNWQGVLFLVDGDPGYEQAKKRLGL